MSPIGTNRTKNEVREWLQSQDTYTLHKPTRRRFTRRRVVVYGIDHQWQADLVDLSKLSSYNKGFNRVFQKFLKEHDVQFFTTYNEETKASIVERFNRTLKTKMWKFFTHRETLTYVDVLSEMVAFYNHTVHRTIGIPPAEVTWANQTTVSKRLYTEIQQRGSYWNIK